MPEKALFSADFLNFLKVSAIIGLIVTTVLIINLNYHAFNLVFKERNKLFWTLFFTMVLIPLLVLLYLFTIFFTPAGKDPNKNPALRVTLYLKQVFSFDKKAIDRN